jgi:hypothetical protein
MPTGRWADASGPSLIINGLPPGPHKILIQLENANHQPLDQDVVQFTIPDVATEAGHHLPQATRSSPGS